MEVILFLLCSWLFVIYVYASTLLYLFNFEFSFFFCLFCHSRLCFSCFLIFQKPIQNLQNPDLPGRLVGRSLCWHHMGLLAHPRPHEVREHSGWRSSALHRDDMIIQTLQVDAIAGAGLSPSESSASRGKCISYCCPGDGSCCSPFLLCAVFFFFFHLTHHLPPLEGFEPNMSLSGLFLMWISSLWKETI